MRRLTPIEYALLQEIRKNEFVGCTGGRHGTPEELRLAHSFEKRKLVVFVDCERDPEKMMHA